MADVNTFCFTGRLTKDPEVKPTEKSAIGNFTIAVNYFDSRDKTEKASFFDIKCFSHNANYVGKYAKKGSPVTVSGEVRQERWEHEGQNRSKIVFYADKVKLEGKKETENNSGQPQYDVNKYESSQQYNVNNKSQEAFVEDNPFNDFDIPF